jgi:polar amino acid transport system substrate-binding protein
MLRRALAAAALLAAALGADAAGHVVRLSYETKANPPRYLGEGTTIDAQRPGLTVELLRLVERRVGVRFDFVRVPWARSMYLLETNQVDGVFHGSWVAERERFASYPMKDGRPDATRSIFTQSYHLYARKGAHVAWNGDQLAVGGPVGTTRGYSVARWLQERGVRVEEENDLPSSLRKVLAGRLEAYAELENMAAAVIARHGDEMRDLVKLEPALRTVPYYLMLSKGFVKREPALAERIWSAIGEARRSPEYRELERKYGVAS